MKITVSRGNLSTAISVCGKAIANTSTVEATTGFLLEAKGDRLTITGYNFEMSIRCEIEADIKEEGAAVLPKRIFQDVVNRSNGDTVKIETEDGKCKLKSDDTSTKFATMDPIEFPEMPKTDSENGGMTLTAKMKKADLRKVVSQCIYAVSSNINRPPMTGVLFEIRGTRLCTVGTDGFRLSKQCCEIDASNDIEFIAPACALNSLSRLKGEGDVTIKYGNRHILFDDSETHMQLICKRIDGSFIDWRRVLPCETASSDMRKVTIDREAFCEALERVMVVNTSANDRACMMLAFSKDSITLSVKTACGCGKDTVGTIEDSSSRSFEIAFNGDYLIDSIKHIESENIDMYFTTPTSAGYICEEGENLTAEETCIHLILPIRIKRT